MPNKESIVNKAFVAPHRLVSRDVIEKDIPRIKIEAKRMLEACHVRHGIFNGGFAVAHPQVTDRDPLRFFVTADGKVYVNPEIVKHTRHFVDSSEGCLSYPMKAEARVKRYNKIRVKFKQFSGDGETFTGVLEVGVEGKLAKIFQHEIDHLDAKYVFDNEEVN